MAKQRRDFLQNFFPTNALQEIVAETQTTAPPPSAEVIALNRMGYGPRPGEIEEVQKKGLKQYIEEQLNPIDSQDTLLNQQLTKARLKIKYKGKKGRFAAVDENRPLKLLNAPVEQLWKLLDRKKVHRKEQNRPTEEVMVATWLRATYSKWQLREVMTEFWHNHFNVSVQADRRIAVTLPVYDREVIRKNCFGNFRTFLEDVAKSVAMQYYLDNVYSKASPANENYARELFELHTLGADHYLNHLYDQWREVPGATQGNPQGYIDEDVYEAARSFTGWTIANGARIKGGERLPNTGKFYYYEGWHDNYQKRVLGTEFSSNQAPLADGKKVLDLVAYHAGTAQFICTKLCRRLVADEPPQSLIDKAVAAWMQHQKSPDQIKQVLRAILFAPEFTQNWGKKVKRPFELLTSFLRATNAQITPHRNMHYLLVNMGYQMFQWATPTGHPDVTSYWINSHMMLTRWNLMSTLVFGRRWHKSAKFNLPQQTPKSAQSAYQIADYWVKRILGRTVKPQTRMMLANYLAGGGSPDEPPFGNPKEVNFRLKAMIALIGMSPDFQWR